METVLLQLAPARAPDRAVIRPRDAFPAAVPVATGLGLAFLNVAQARAGHPAVASKDGVFSYAWLLQAAECVRDYLCARPDYAAGARVALKLSNSPEYLAAFYGVLLADGVAVPLPVALERARQQEILALCRPDLLLTRREGATAADCEAAGVVWQLPEHAGVALPRPMPQRQGNDLAMLLFTSGSTGAPKGVMLSHRNLLANAASILRTLPIGADDRALAVLPFCHAFGNSILQTHVLAGATLLVEQGSPFPTTIVESIRQSGATSFSATPELYGMLLKYGGLGAQPLPALRYMTVAGGEMRYAQAAEVADRIAPATFHVMYGQSEASPRLATLPPRDLHVRRGSIGKPIDGVTLTVMDEAGRELPPGADGMLCARGDNVMLGYFEDAAATAEVLGADGWLRTGDRAYRDADGYFYLRGRANLLVKIQGHRVHPAEIERLVEADFPHTRAVALPITQGDQTRLALFLAPQDSHPIDLADIRATCQRELPPYKVPVHFEVVEHFPLTSALKVDRVRLGRRVAALAPSAT